jgi:hypothetical protein
MLEPEWDEATRDLALALDDVERCDACGGLAWLCQSAEHAEDWEVGAPKRCHRLTALREAQKRFTEESNPHLDALIWSVGLREEAARAG